MKNSAPALPPLFRLHCGAYSGDGRCARTPLITKKLFLNNIPLLDVRAKGIDYPLVESGDQSGAAGADCRDNRGAGQPTAGGHA
ncbi:hypothetical protein OQJ46_08425 [Microbulbifer thermotolerans]|uniref:Uncharacterized protein n=2 Tax=Microbulbifer thermotolerans TaxID=252514 RepID=A0AB35I266_MICTH|nr:hypothetical protein [Microbulbifer thermotolerans]MCX2783013.1 hypothetical protein [Microbulbifer thermotolerans]MCX2802758.1 hypothetical protein [Microbulbifer thermotolerans]